MLLKVLEDWQQSRGYPGTVVHSSLPIARVAGGAENTMPRDFLPGLLTPCYLHQHWKHRIYDLSNKTPIVKHSVTNTWQPPQNGWEIIFNSFLSSEILAGSSTSPSNIHKMYNLTLWVLTGQTSGKPGSKTEVRRMAEKGRTRQKGGNTEREARQKGRREKNI